jgi:hypothetical protein
VLEDDLSSALLQFRRRATQLAQLEDWYIFNGTYAYEGQGFPGSVPPTVEVNAQLAPYFYGPNYSFLTQLIQGNPAAGPDPREPIADHAVQLKGLRQRNPGALGLMGGARVLAGNGQQSVLAPLVPSSIDGRGLITGIVQAMSTLEGNGYAPPYVCVFGRVPFVAAHASVGGTIAYPRDRLEPLIGRALLHAAAIDTPPFKFDMYSPPDDWDTRGALISLAGGSVDLAIAAEATPEFRQVDVQGRYVFSVFERFTLRIKDSNAIVPLLFRAGPAPEAVGPEAVEQEAVGPEAVEQEAVGPEAVEQEAVEQEAVGPEAVEQEALRQEAATGTRRGWLTRVFMAPVTRVGRVVRWPFGAARNDRPQAG